MPFSLCFKADVTVQFSDCPISLQSRATAKTFTEKLSRSTELMTVVRCEFTVFETTEEEAVEEAVSGVCTNATWHDVPL